MHSSRAADGRHSTAEPGLDRAGGPPFDRRDDPTHRPEGISKPPEGLPVVRPACHVRPLLGVGLQGEEFLTPIARADVVHPAGDHPLHRPLGGRLAALVREIVGLAHLHE